VSAHPPIALLTDFGTSDWYVAELKAVLLTQAPGCPLVDVAHAIPPGDVAQGAFVLARAHAAFPAGTVFVAVVDPGVGTARHPLAVLAGGRFYVGPDNGLLEAALDVAGAEARIIEDGALLERAAQTFHGRDVFAPAAARIATHGTAAWRALGRVLAAPARLPPPEAAGADHTHAEALARAASSARLVTRVAYVDRFGNAITHLHELELEAWLGGADPADMVVRAHGAAGARITEIRGLAGTYGQRPPGPIALIGSSGLLEIALPGGHAALALGLAPGDEIDLTLAPRG